MRGKHKFNFRQRLSSGLIKSRLVEQLLTYSQRASSVLRQACDASLVDLDVNLEEDSFDSQELLAEFQRLSLPPNSEGLSANTKDSGIGRPNKRRKVYDEVDILDEIISDLYTVFGLTITSGLDGLSQITE